MSNQARKTFYTQARDIIRKIAEDAGPGRRILQYTVPVVETSEEKIEFSWNLSYDTHYERFPDDIARCLKYALMAERKLNPIVPKYNRLTRSDQIVTVEVSTLPIQLRSIIGNRWYMQQHGATLINTLIKGYFELKKTGCVMRGIQPSTIYLSEDLREVQFTDLLSIVRKYDYAPHGVKCDSPYSIIGEHREKLWLRSN